MRTTEENSTNSLVITDENVVSVVPAGTQIVGFPTDDEEFVENAREDWQSVWESAEEFDLRTPAAHESNTRFPRSLVLKQPETLR